MPEKEFSIEFYYNDEQYFGNVQPFVAAHRTLYRVTLQIEGRSDCLEFVLKPSHSDLDQWEFHSVDGLPVSDYDQIFLQELGDQVSQCLGPISPERV